MRGGITTREGKTPSPSATLSTTYLTWTDVGSSLVLRGYRPTINHMNHDKALMGNIPSGNDPTSLFVPNRKDFKTNLLLNSVASYDTHIIYK